MVKSIVILGFLFIFGDPQPNPVKWTFYASRKSSADFELHMKAKIDKGWHIFALNNIAGPGPTNVNLKKQSGIRFEGSVEQVLQPKVFNDLAFQADVLAFSEKAEFVQLIKRKDSTVSDIGGTIRYMACNGANCLAPITDSFQVKLP